MGQNGGPLLAFENGGGPGAFLALRLVGPAGNPTCVGARVALGRDDGRRQIAEVCGGGGCLSQSSATLFFGMPAAGEGSARLGVIWPNGSETQHEAAPGTATMVLTMPSIDRAGNRAQR